MTARKAADFGQWRDRLVTLQTELLPLIEAIRDSGLNLHAEATELALGEILPDLERIGVAIGDLAGKIDQLSDESLVKTLFRATDIAESRGSCATTCVPRSMPSRATERCFWKTSTSSAARHCARNC